MLRIIITIPTVVRLLPSSSALGRNRAAILFARRFFLLRQDSCEAEHIGFKRLSSANNACQGRRSDIALGYADQYTKFTTGDAIGGGPPHSSSE
jgi:hypothetical protein